MTKKSVRSIFFVMLQFLLLILIVYFGEFEISLLSLTLILTSLILGIWPVIIMKFRVSIFPEVKKNQKLYRSGPYKYIRHPMYTALLLFCAGYILNNNSLFLTTLYLTLVITLTFKSSHEEKLLEEKFSEYKSYKKDTRRFIPFIF